MLGHLCNTTHTGIRIGIAYERPKNYWSDPDAERLQAALLTKPRKKGLFCFWRWK